ncbi:MAG: hypothetical protein ABIL18_08255, partial [candidate division WOR-3 bacterium]
KTTQMYPTVGVRTWGAYIGWQDSRWCDFDVYRQGVYWNGGMYGYNTMLSTDSFSQYQQTYPDIEGNPTNYFVCVWEDSSYHPGKERPAEIWARIYTNQPFRVYAGSRSQKRPSVSCRDNGEFVVTFTNFDPGDYPKLIWRRYNSAGNFLNGSEVWPVDSLKHHIPITRVAYCDSGFIIVYDDSSAGGTQRSIYMQYRKRNGDLVKERELISNSGAYNEDYPAVAVNQGGFGVIVWHYWASPTNIDIYCRTFQMYPEGGGISFGPILAVTTSPYPARYPRVTVFPNNDFFIVWEEYREARTGYNVYGRAWIGAGFHNEFVINEDTLYQGCPDVECRNMDSCYVTWMSQEIENIPGTYYDIFCRPYWHNPDGMIPLTSGPIRLIPAGDTVGGRKTWYFDDENYDLPGTTWNEDPIDEPDSVYLDLDSAIVDQLAELNTNGQYRIFNEDTIPWRREKALTDYDAVFIDLGYRTDASSAGTISNEEQSALLYYINTRHPTMVEGNDFGYMYNGTTLYSKYGANYLGDGASYKLGNIDTLYGVAGTSFADETLKYDYKTLVDNYVDSISPKIGYELILQGSGAPGRWWAGRAIGWGNYWKGGRPTQDSFKIYTTFPLSGIKSTTHPHTYAEFYRRCLGYLGLNCQPEPITTLTAATGSSEGRVTITWKVVSDDKPGESAEGSYKLKFRRNCQKITSETAFEDSSETYYQTWNTADSAVGALVTQNLYGLPPMDTLVFALKVSDESGLWNALGDEPMAIVSGDSVTPHTITFGQNYVKDFSNRYEYMNRRRINDTGTDYDSLFVTWNTTTFEVGFARCNFNTEGDLFIYVDTKPGGADSTVPYNGSSGRSSFKAQIGTFAPDYCLIVENATIRDYKKWSAKDGRGSWVSINSGGTYVVEDNVVNNYLYTELYIRFDTMAYTAGNPFKLVVLMTEENTNKIINAFPIFNPLGEDTAITQYYYWDDDGLTSNKVPNKVQIIGIEETAVNPKSEIRNPKLTVHPNPFTEKTEIFLPSVDVPGRDASLKIYD